MKTMLKNYNSAQTSDQINFLTNDKKDCNDSVEKTLRGISRTTYGNVFMINYLENRFDFIPVLPAYISNLTTADISKIGLDFLKQISTSEDQKILQAVRSIMFKFYQNLSFNDRLTHTLNFDFHTVNKENKLILLNCKITPVQLTDSGSIWRAVCNLTLSLNKSSGNIQISSAESENIFLYDLKQNRWKKSQKKTLTPKELDVFRYYLQGLSIQEIADIVFLSVDTVKWHRRKLLEKLNVADLNEALAYAVTNNLI
ncbi:response regulator transcription factor [Chryseobacterium sp. RR2-3-20]|uniref:response regulator transcription factor n=1 Tax=Chryseobacterium sp. RR2-3-20 TaxID=2787626 RepID=UPI001ADF7502|nr:helix-turn-helix transcriptional regulator [Chryseobacterium sp. RR2-3-20]